MYLHLLHFIEFFPEKLKFKRDMWTDNDRNMSHFFMRAYSNFAAMGYVFNG
jgi:neuroligin